MSSLLPDPLRDQDAPPRVLVEALREEPLEPAWVDSAYERFLRRRAAAPVRLRGPRFVRYAALAVLMAVGSVYAATLIRPLVPSRGEQPPADARPPLEAAPPRRAVSPPPVAKDPREDAAAEEEPTSAPPVLPPAPAAGVREPSRGPSPVPSAEQWRRAAQGLRDGDYRSADAALKELTRKGTEADRESAQLVQAQVLLAQGREKEAKGLLRTLEKSARAPSVRRKSVELLERLRTYPAARSDKARGVSNPP